MNNFNLLGAAAALALGLPAAHAATQLTDSLTFSGFGTVGYVAANTDEGEFRREFQPDGAGKKGSLKVDSNLGLQLSYKATDWLSATVQSLTMQRVSHDMTTRFEWAYLKATPIEGLSVRAGRMSLPNFLISDSRRVGYANTWLRPANEVYGVDLLNGGLKGLDVSYRLPLGGNGLTVTALGGTTSIDQSTSKSEVKSVRGLNAVWEGDGYSVRVGRLEGKPDLGGAPPLPPGPGPGPGPGSFPALLGEEVYTFTGIGATVDSHNVVLQAEYVRRRSSQGGALVDANGWYVLGGYRFGSFLPYLQIAKAGPANSSAPKQKTTAIGLRWDAFSSAALKFQFEHVDTEGTPGYSFATVGFGPSAAPVTKPVNVFGVALDFVF
jgi:hypothetical protein